MTLQTLWSRNYLFDEIDDADEDDGLDTESYGRVEHGPIQQLRPHVTRLNAHRLLRRNKATAASPVSTAVECGIGPKSNSQQTA